MYIFGFREGWQFIFPEHPALVVDLITYEILFGVALVSAGFAFRIQYLILAVIAASLVSIFGTVFVGELPYEPQMWGDFPGFPEDGFQGTDFWMLFALFFPAATGIMAGANMSGELKDPRRSIPLGTLSAVAVGTVVYMVLAWWLARSATPEELVGNYMIMIDRALWGPAVLAGLLGATFSSGLASLVGAPRILQALADLTSKAGTVKLLGLPGGGEGARLRRELPEFTRAFREKGVFAQMTFIEETGAGEGLVAAMQALEGTFFRPNCVFLRLPHQVEPARTYLEQVTDLARLPKARVRVESVDLEEQLVRMPTADLDIFGLAEDPDFESARRMLRRTSSSCLFVRDSDEENVLA